MAFSSPNHSQSAAPSDSSAADMLQEVFSKQRTAFGAAPYPSYNDRIEVLECFRSAIAKRHEGFKEAIHSDFGNRGAEESEVLELVPTHLSISYAIDHLHNWMEAEHRESFWGTWPSKAEIFRQPLGVIGVISPWNYPLLLAASTLVGAFAAGNRAILKPSEFAPQTAELWRELASTDFPEEQFYVCPSDREYAEALSKLPLDHLHFTGSTRVGRLVAQAAATNLTPLTLELGGKSPTIIDQGYRIKKGIKSLVLGKLYNSGQSCVAPDYLFVHRSQKDEFCDAFKKTVAEFYPSIASNSDYANIINPHHHKRLRQHLENAQQLGATLLEVNPANESTEELGQKICPTLIQNPSDEMSVIQEEVFGPLLPVLEYDHIDEAFSYIQARPRPLAAYIYSHRDPVIDRVKEEITSGSLGVNVATIQAGLEALPFGGVGESGMGSYHGEDGFLRFSHQKSVLQQSHPNLTRFLDPPYKQPLKRGLVNFLLPKTKS